MPTRSSKGGKSAASKKDRTTHGGGGRPTPPKPSPPAPPAPLDESDPPIVIQGGGSVTIYSTKPFTPRPAGPKYPYVYYNGELSIGKMKMHGKADKDDESNNGNFKVELYGK